MNESKKVMALLCAFILVFSTAMSGCAKKVKYNENEPKTDGKIKIGDSYEDIPEDAEIVVGEDGKSYIVDGEGNSMVYDAPSAYVVASNGTTASTTTTTKKTTTTTTTVKVIPSTTTTTTTSQQDGVISTLLNVRKIGYDEPTGLTKYDTDVMHVKFQEAEDEWLIEFHKGIYGTDTIGCEIGIYKRTNSDSAFKKITEIENIATGANLFNGSSKVAGFASSKIGIGWHYDFEKGTADSPKKLVMAADIVFPTSAMANAFMDALEEKGFTEGDTSDPNESAEKFNCTDKTVSLAWKNTAG